MDYYEVSAGSQSNYDLLNHMEIQINKEYKEIKKHVNSWDQNKTLHPEPRDSKI
jgi:hypothetical protein